MADGRAKPFAKVIVVPAFGGIAQHVIGRINLGHAVLGVSGPVDVRMIFFGKGAVSRVNYFGFRFGINLQDFVIIYVRFAFKFSQDFRAVR